MYWPGKFWWMIRIFIAAARRDRCLTLCHAIPLRNARLTVRLLLAETVCGLLLVKLRPLKTLEQSALRKLRAEAYLLFALHLALLKYVQRVAPNLMVRKPVAVRQGTTEVARQVRLCD